MEIPKNPRARPALPEAAGQELVRQEREYSFAVRVAAGDLRLPYDELRDLLVNVLASYEESRRINAGLTAEVAALKKRLEVAPEQRVDPESLVPGLERAYTLINDALKEA